ncbi:MAG: hypothetical protein J5915_01695, partial [Acidaminococcaceae bacterium]|nr:hypothetical protein [Acidaminococcaceae bacterium]
MSEIKKKTGTKTGKSTVAAERKAPAAVKRAAAVVKKRIKSAAVSEPVQNKAVATVREKKVTKADLQRPEYFFNRELSWLKFNLRVLREAEVETTPILERLKFIAITSSN